MNFKDMKYKFMSIEGPIGVGKTTLAKKLAERLNAQYILEETNNPFLAEFYEDRKRASFKVQIFFLLNRYVQLLNIKQSSLFHQILISDFIIEKDKIFAYLNLDDFELNLYNKLYDLLVNGLPKPDIVIYLQATVDTLLHRIRKRKSVIDKNISVDYLKEVVSAFDYFFFHYRSTPLLVINTNKIDFVYNEEHFKEIERAIKVMKSGTYYYTPWIDHSIK